MVIDMRRNPVHSVLYPDPRASSTPPALFVLIAGAEFLAMILVVVYVGAVAVLFLFVVMMLDVDFAAAEARAACNIAPFGVRDRRCILVARACCMVLGSAVQC